jgi:hypothetical protein
MGYTPNVVVEWLTLLRIREVPRSDLGPEDDYPEWEVSWHSSVTPGKSRDNALNQVMIASSTSFPIHHSISILSFDAVYFELLEKRRQINYKQANKHMGRVLI